jgi:hypothetical protein
MTPTLPFLDTRTVAVPVEFFAVLRPLVDGEGAAAAIERLRDAGYAAGVASFGRFTTWLADRGEHGVDDLADDRFPALLREFLVEAGWGSVAIEHLGDAVLAVDSADWAEAHREDPDAPAAAAPSCHVSTGFLAGFLGCVADAPLAVLEVECRAAGADRCRFLVGSIDVLGYVHEAMGRGIPYDRAALSAA